MVDMTFYIEFRVCAFDGRHDLLQRFACVRLMVDTTFHKDFRLRAFDFATTCLVTVVICPQYYSLTLNMR